MQPESNLAKIEARCTEVMNSPYLRKDPPPELKNLRTLLEKVALLLKEDVPPLIAEVRQLRSKNKKLEAELEALRLNV
jgi:hypothetical protein